jgi:hypothetical protein
MPWKQCRISINTRYERLLEGVRLLALANGNSPDIALFTRTTPDHEHRVLLLSPKAVELAGDALPDCWTDWEAPELFEWDPVFGPPQACERFGLVRPSFGHPSPIPPVTFGGDDPEATPA